MINYKDLTAEQLAPYNAMKEYFGMINEFAKEQIESFDNTIKMFNRTFDTPFGKVVFQVNTQLVYGIHHFPSLKGMRFEFEDSLTINKLNYETVGGVSTYISQTNGFYSEVTSSNRIVTDSAEQKVIQAIEQIKPIYWKQLLREQTELITAIELKNFLISLPTAYALNRNLSSVHGIFPPIN